jgi:hypothetical protein
MVQLPGACSTNGEKNSPYVAHGSLHAPQPDDNTAIHLQMSLLSGKGPLCAFFRAFFQTHIGAAALALSLFEVTIDCIQVMIEARG